MGQLVRAPNGRAPLATSSTHARHRHPQLREAARLLRQRFANKYPVYVWEMRLEELVRALCSRRLKQPHTMQVTEDDDPESRGRLAPHELPYGMGAGVERAMEPVERRTDDALDTLASKRSFSSSFSGSVFGVAYLFLVLQRHLCELLLTAGRLRNEVSRQAVSSRRRRFVAGFTRI